jgi:hypothetical protein
MTRPSSFMRRMEKESGGSHGNTSEKRVAKKIGARLQPASGAMVGAKGDAKLGGAMKMRVECKSTIGDYLKLDIGWLTKISGEAMEDASTPALTISFVTADGRPRMNMNAEWVAIPMSAFQELLDAYNAR